MKSSKLDILNRYFMKSNFVISIQDVQKNQGVVPCVQTSLKHVASMVRELFIICTNSEPYTYLFSVH
jgi:hypothetical protein